MSPVMGPLRPRDQGKPRDLGEGKILRIVIVVGHCQKIQAPLLCHCGQGRNIVLSVGSIGVDMQVPNEPPGAAGIKGNFIPHRHAATGTSPQQYRRGQRAGNAK